MENTENDVKSVIKTTEERDDVIVDVICDFDYSEKISKTLEMIDGYYNNNETRDEYPYFRVNNAKKYIPRLNKSSDILNERILNEVLM